MFRKTLLSTSRAPGSFGGQFKSRPHPAPQETSQPSLKLSGPQVCLPAFKVLPQLRTQGIHGD